MADELRSYWTNDRLVDLLNSAQHHLRNRQPDRATAIWHQLIHEGGEGADWGHLEYAEHLFIERQDGEAKAELAALLEALRISDQPWRIAVALLEMRGDLAGALFWYSRAADHLAAEKVTVPFGPPWAKAVWSGQRRLKWKAGVPLDDCDLLAGIGNDEMDAKWYGVLDLLRHPELAEERLQFWARDEFEEPLKPSDVRITGDLDDYYNAIERELQDANSSRITLVPRHSETLLPVVEAGLNARTMADLSMVTSQCDVAETLDWPPGRNQPCWCGSGTKYKKCCGGIDSPPLRS